MQSIQIKFEPIIRIIYLMSIFVGMYKAFPIPIDPITSGLWILCVEFGLLVAMIPYAFAFIIIEKVGRDSK